MNHEGDKILPLELADSPPIDLSLEADRRELILEQRGDSIELRSARDVDTLIAALQSRRQRMVE